MIEKNPESVTGMSVETLEQKIAKQEERLKQLKAQKQAVIAREKRNNLNRNEKMKLDVKILLGSYLIKKWKMNKTKKNTR